MYCACCGEETAKGIKIKMGHICTECLGKLPASVAESPARYDRRQVRRLAEAFSDRRSPDPKEAVTNPASRFCVCEEYVFLKGARLYFKDMKEIRLVYHPLEDAGDGTAYVRATVAVRLKKMSGEIEETIADRMLAGYKIDGNRITYEGFKVLPEILEEINAAIRQGGGLHAYREKKRKEEARERMWKAHREREEEKRRRQRGEDTYYKGRRKTRNAGTGTVNNESPLDAAMRLFSVKMPYSLEQIKKERNRLLKVYHPDEEGGSTEKSVEINQAFDLLKRFAG